MSRTAHELIALRAARDAAHDRLVDLWQRDVTGWPPAALVQHDVTFRRAQIAYEKAQHAYQTAIDEVAKTIPPVASWHDSKQVAA